MLDIHPLTSETWPALVDLFTSRATGLPTLRMCWCQYWRLRAKDFATSRVPELRDRLRGAADGPLPPGLIAVRDGLAVGWVGLGPREDFERIERSRVIPRVDDAPAWAIVCFAVSSSARGEGLGVTLLQAAVEFAASRGATVLEAYPVALPPDAAVDPDSAFTGTLAMFERAGFHVVADTASSAGGYPRVVVRRELAT